MTEALFAPLLNLFEIILNLTREERRRQQDFIIIQLMPLHESIHNHYIRSFASSLDKYKSNHLTSKELIDILKVFSYENEGSRVRIREQLIKVNNKKWNTKNQELFKLVGDYFNIDKCFAPESHFINDEFYEVSDFRDYPRSEVGKIIYKSMRDKLSLFTGSKSFIELMDYIEEYGKKNDNAEITEEFIHDFINNSKFDNFFTNNVYISREDIINISCRKNNNEEKRNIIINRLDYLINDLRDKWKKCSAKYSEITLI